MYDTRILEHHGPQSHSHNGQPSAGTLSTLWPYAQDTSSLATGQENRILREVDSQLMLST